MAYAPPAPPLVQAQFKLIADGLPEGYCTSVKLPQRKPKLTKVQSAGAAQEHKFPSGLAEYDDLEAKFIHGRDNVLQQWVQAWLDQLSNPETGQTGVAPEDAKRSITVQQLDVDGATVVAEHECVGCILMDPGAISLEGGKEDAVIVDVKFSVDYVLKRQ